jgi:hypothetical protein
VEVRLIEMHVEILNGVVCRVCGAPMGKILDENEELLGYTCYGKTPHPQDEIETGKK